MPRLRQQYEFVKTLRRSLTWLLLCSICTSSGAVLGAQNTPDPIHSAAVLIREGQYESAIHLIQHALKADPADPRLFTLEGIAFSLKGDDEQALKHLRKALLISPAFPRALQAEASILSRHRDPAAIPVLERILHADPGDAVAHEMLGLAKAQEGMCVEALREFAFAGAVVLTHAESLQQKAACLLDTKAFPEAVQTFRQVSQLRPEDRGAVYDLALAQYEAGEATAANATLAPLLDHAADVDTLLLAADIFEEQGDTPRAATTLRKAIVANPGRSNSYVRFAELCMAHESYQAGVDMVSAGIARIPADSSLLLARGLLFGGMARYDDAEADFRTAEKIDPHHGTGAYGVGLIQKQRNDSTQAFATVRTALKVHPEDAQLHLLLARLLVDSGSQSASEALQEAIEAVRLAPTLVAARNVLTSIYQNTGQPTLAVEQARAALALDPRDSTALYRLMRSLRAIGKDEEAHALGQQVSEQLQRSRDTDTKRLSFRIEGTTPSKTTLPLP